MSELTTFHDDIKNILQLGRSQARTAVNFAMVEAYWLIGQCIVSEEQKGEERAAYGMQILKQLAAALSSEFGKGLDERELRRIRQFYLCFPIWDAVRPELSWTYYRTLIRVSSEDTRQYYLKESVEQKLEQALLDNLQKFLLELGKGFAE